MKKIQRPLRNPVKLMNSVDALGLMKQASTLLRKITNLTPADRELLAKLAEQIRLHRKALEPVIGEEKLT